MTFLLKVERFILVKIDDRQKNKALLIRALRHLEMSFRRKYDIILKGNYVLQLIYN